MGRTAPTGIALAVSCCLLVSCVSCSKAPTDPESDGARPTTAAPTSSGGRASQSPTDRPAPDPGPAVPFVPATSDASRLARQVERAGAVLQDRSAPAGAVRRAAEFQQLAASALARAPEGFQQEVMTRLDRSDVTKVRGDLRAAELLLSMGDPQPRLPRWRIVRPPPPEELVRHYRRAQRGTGVPWHYLAAIHLVETRMGRIRGVSTAGAVGPMQFLPTTWDLYGEGGDITDPGDAILAAGRLLRANGAPGDMAEALWHYNPSDAYVGAVTAYARTMERTPATYREYWHWRVLYRHVRGTYVLPVGYPEQRPVRLPGG